MALASQSIPSNYRRRVTFSQRRLLTPKVIGILTVAVVLILGSWWLIGRGGEDGTAPTNDSVAGMSEGGDPIGLSGSAQLPPSPSHTPNAIGAAATGTDGRRTNTGDARTPSLRTLVADDRAAGESAHGANGAIEMGSRLAPPPGPAASPPTTPPTTPARTAPVTSPPTAPPQTPPPTAPGGTAQQREQPTSAPFSTGSSNADLAKALQLQATDPISARVMATRALDGGSLTPSDRERGYELVNALGKSLFLNTNINPNDPLMRVHTIVPGESLAKIVRNDGLACETSLLKRLNGIKDERRIQIGQKLRVPKGAFHAEVIKSEFRLNLYLDAGEGSTERVMVTSLRCGLGESNGTPTGLFRVRPRSKLIDPEWTHPKTGEHFASNDPKNPIGEHWIGIMGVEETNKDLMGYGIHGTVDPDSIGHERSLGCVRMMADDIAFVYECLTDPQSTIRIR